MTIAILIIIAFAIYAGLVTYKVKALETAFVKLSKAMDDLTKLKAEEFELDRVQFGNFLLQSRGLEERNRVTDADLANFQESLTKN